MLHYRDAEGMMTAMPEMLKSIRYASSLPVDEEALEAAGFAMLAAVTEDEHVASLDVGPVLAFDYECSAFELTFGREVASRSDWLAMLADVQRVLNRRLVELDKHDEPALALESAGDLALI